MEQTLKQGVQISQWHIKKVLGIGGFGVTYLAHDERLDRLVAIKEYLPAELGIRDSNTRLVHPRTGSEENYQFGLDKFLEEAKVLAQFSHPNIVRVQAFEEANNTAYLIMDYEEGEDLSDYLKRTGFKGGMPETELKGYLVPILKGLQAVHDKGLLHRDVKPGNIYLRKDAEPMLIDFGAARYALGEHSKSMSAIISMGYAPPEQYSSKAKQSPASDLYAWGATAYELITGKPPVESPDRSNAIFEDEPDPLKPLSQTHKGKYSDTLLSVIDQCLNIPQKKRPQSALDIIKKLTGEQLFKSRTIKVNPSDRFKKTKENQQKKVHKQQIKLNKEGDGNNINNTTLISKKLGITLVVLLGSIASVFLGYKHFESEPNSIQPSTQSSNPDTTMDDRPNTDPQPSVITTQINEEPIVDTHQDLKIDIDDRSQHEESDKLAWEAAKKENTEQSYQKYITEYVNGIYLSQAKKALKDIKQLSQFSADQSNIVKAEEYFKNGDLAYNKGEYIEAKEWFLKASKLKYAKAITRLGNLYYFAYGVKKDLNKAADYYQRAADLNDDDAQVYLGYMYERGEGVNKNLSRAKAWYEKALTQNNQWAQYNLAQMYKHGNGVEKNDKKAFEFYLKAADQGHIQAQSWVGSMYQSAQGVEQDFKKAFEYYLMSAEQNNSYSQRKIGWLYQTGNGTNIDLTQAFKWYQKAANQGDMYAQYNLGEMYRTVDGVEKNDKKAFELHSKAANQNYSNAQNLLAWMYENGIGTNKNLNKAKEWYERAVSQNNSNAQRNLGYMYEKGIGVEIDYTKAKELYQLSAKQNNSSAQVNLGYLYTEGLGVEVNYKKAAELFSKAADQNNLIAITSLGILYKQGNGVKRDDNKAFNLFEKAANQNHLNGLTNLGWMYEMGRGVSRDYNKAVEYYTKAADQNYSQAQANLGVMYREGWGVKKDNKKAVELFNKAAEQNHVDSYQLLGDMYKYGSGVLPNRKKAISLYKKAAKKGHSLAIKRLANLGITEYD